MKDYIHLATFTYPSDMITVKSTLEGNGIECYVRDELTIQVHNFLSNAIGGIRLEVPGEKYEDAIRVLKNSGFENYIAVQEQTQSEKEKDEKTKKYLKIAIKIIVAVCLIWFLLIIFLFLNE